MSKNNDVVIIELDRPRQLWFGYAAVKKIHAMLGQNKDLDNLGDLDPEDIEKIMYCLLMKDAKAHGEILKLSDMEELLDYIQFGDLVRKLEEAIEKGTVSTDLEENKKTDRTGMKCEKCEENKKNLKRIALEAQK